MAYGHCIDVIVIVAFVVVAHNPLMSCQHGRTRLPPPLVQQLWLSWFGDLARN